MTLEVHVAGDMMIKLPDSSLCPSQAFNDEMGEEKQLGFENSPLKRKRDSEKVFKRRTRSLTQPTYLLESPGCNNLRHHNRSLLFRLLQKLVRRRNWPEAAAVLIVFLKATRKETSPATNRFKYLVSMQLLKHIENGRPSLTTIDRIYDTWMARIGIKLSRKRIRHIKPDTFVVRLESILSRLLQGNIEDERQNARSLMQEHGFESHSIFNMIIGLIFYQLWYSTIPADIQWGDFNQSCTPTHSNMSKTRYSHEGGESEAPIAVFDKESTGSFQYDSDSSVMQDKEIRVGADGDIGFHREPIGIAVTTKGENVSQHLQHQGFYVNSTENEIYVGKDGDHEPIISSWSAFLSLDSWLVPLRTENWGLDSIMKDDEYMNAVKYLQEAVYSRPPVLAALLPLTQLLLIGFNVKDALDGLEKFSVNSDAAFPCRLQANILERVEAGNNAILATCYEDALRSDPTCGQTLAKLLSLHQNGDYSPENMLEMIALHLEAVFPEHKIWREFALCFLKVYQYNEDRMSACLDSSTGGQRQEMSARYNRIPEMFVHGESGSTWTLRCRWWLRRHFSRSMLASEIDTGDLQLVTYKAACASHLYGPELEYVVRAYGCLEKTQHKDLFLFLQKHMRSSIGLHNMLRQRSHTDLLPRQAWCL